MTDPTDPAVLHGKPRAELRRRDVLIIKALVLGFFLIPWIATGGFK